MQNVVVEKPYEFIPPVHSEFWPFLVQRILRKYLRSQWGVVSSECRGVSRLQASLDAGHSVILAPNHCRLCDPMVLGFLAREVDVNFYSMASWHLFQESRFTHFMLRRLGAFSIYREGTDRQAIQMAVNLLAEGRRPLVIYPEGAVSRHNDLITPLLDGVAFVAHLAAKKRHKADPPGKVCMHPIAIRYYYRGDIKATVEPVVQRLEERLAWWPLEHKPLLERLERLQKGFLSLKELEYLGEVRQGDFYDRTDRLIEDVLEPLEEEWKIAEKNVSVLARVKNLRTAIVPDLVAGKCDETERTRRWDQLAACYYAQGLWHYPRDYLDQERPLPERVLETVERLEEDFTDHTEPRGPLHVVIEVGDRIDVDPEESRKKSAECILPNLKGQLQTMISALAEEAQGVELARQQEAKAQSQSR